MRHLAIEDMPRLGFWASLRHGGHCAPTWHAVTESAPRPIKTLCGLPYTTEALRTWDQTPFAERCPQCERLVASANRAKSATFIAEVSPPSPVQNQPHKPRVPKGA